MAVDTCCVESRLVHESDDVAIDILDPEQGRMSALTRQGEVYATFFRVAVAAVMNASCAPCRS